MESTVREERTHFLPFENIYLHLMTFPLTSDGVFWCKMTSWLVKCYYWNGVTVISVSSTTNGDIKGVSDHFSH